MSQAGGALLRRPGRTLAIVLFTGLLCGVAANALFFQTARHPAPMFRGPVIARPTPAVARVPEKLVAAPQAEPMVPPLPVPPPQPQARAEATQKDQIGALIANAAPRAPAAPAKAVDETARILAAQRALVKLGYVLKPDGVMGAGTRKALEMFEQSHKLPVTGELNARVLRELASQSGVAVP